MWVEYPDGTELSDDRTVPGAKSALARGADKDLVTHAKLYDIPEDEDADVAEGDDDGDSPGVDPDLALLGGLALIGLTVGAVSAVGSAVNSARERKVQRRELEWRIAEARRADPSTAAVVNARMTAPAGWYDDGSGRLRWWDGQQWTEHYHVGNPRTAAPAGWYDDGSGRQRWWDGQEWTEHFQGSQSHMPIGSSAAAISGPTATAPSRDVEAAFATPTLSMSRAEWQERVRTMLMARAISDVQWRLLSNARIEDADSALLEWQKELRKLTPREFSDHISYMLADNPDARNRALEAASAGWYDDGSGRERWWDGQAWTEHFQVEEVKVLAIARGSTPSGWYDDGSGRLRWWDGQHWTQHQA